VIAITILFDSSLESVVSSANFVGTLGSVFMHLPPDNVGKDIMFSGCPAVSFARSFVRPFVQTDIVTTISHEQLEQF